MSLLKKLASDTAIYGGSYILGRILNYIILAIYLTHKVSKVDYFAYNELYFYVALILILLTFRMETTYFRFSKDNDKSIIFSASQIIIAILVAIWLIIIITNSAEVATLLNYPNKELYIRILAIIIALDALIAVPFARLRMNNQPIKFGLLKLGQILINVGMVLFFLELAPRLSSMGYTSIEKYYHPNDPILDVFIANLTASASAFLFMSPSFRYFTINKISKPIKNMVYYAIPLVLVGIAGIVNLHAYTTLQKYNLSGSIIENSATAGVYAAAFKIALLLSLFTTAFNFAAEPFFFQNSDRKDSKHIYADVAKAYAIFASFIILLIMMYIDWIPLILGKEFRAGMGVAPILLMAFFFLGLYYNFSIWYKIKDKTKYGTYIAILGMIVTISLSLILLPRMGEIGSAWTTLACYFVMALSCLLIGKRFYPINYPIISIMIYPLTALAIYYIASWAQEYFNMNEIQSFFQNSIIVIIYISVLMKYEWRWVKRAMQRV